LLSIEPSKFYLDNIKDGGHINDVDLIRNAKDFLDKEKQNKKNIRLLMYAIDLVKTLDINYHLISLNINCEEE